MYFHHDDRIWSDIWKVHTECELVCRNLQCTSSPQSQRSVPVQEHGRSPARQTKVSGKSVIQLMADARISAQASFSDQSPDLRFNVSKISSKHASPVAHPNNIPAQNHSAAEPGGKNIGHVKAADAYYHSAREQTNTNKETWRAAQQMRPSEHDMGYRGAYFPQNPFAQDRSHTSSRHAAGMQPVIFSPLSRAALQMEWYQQQHMSYQIGNLLQASQAMRPRLVLPIAPRHIMNQMQNHRDISPPCSQRAVPASRAGLAECQESSDDVHILSQRLARSRFAMPQTSLNYHSSDHKAFQVAEAREFNDAEHLKRLHRISGALMNGCNDSKYEQNPPNQHPTQENCVKGTGLLSDELGGGCFTPWQKTREEMTSPRDFTKAGQDICTIVRPIPLRASHKLEQQREGGESNRQSEGEKDSCDDVEISEDDEPMNDPFSTRASSTAEDYLQYEREKLKNRWADIALCARSPLCIPHLSSNFIGCFSTICILCGRLLCLWDSSIVILPSIPMEAH